MRRPSFTLLELILVLTIMVILAALSYPSLEGMYAGYRVDAAVDQVRTSWALAFSRAVNEGRPYRFAVVQGQGIYRIAPDSGEFWAGSGGSSDGKNSKDTDEKPLVLADKLPKGVRFAVTDQAGTANGSSGGDSDQKPEDVGLSQYTPVLTFLPDGTARDDASLVFSVPGGRSINLKLRAVTGAVSVKPATAASQR